MGAFEIMQSPSTVPIVDEVLDVYGQNPRLDRLYTQLCFAFTLPNGSIETQLNVVNHLKGGLERLSAAFPWTAGNVINDNNTYRITQSHQSTPQLTIRNLNNDLPTMAEYQESDFPFSMLHEDKIAPRRTMPERFNEPAPVLLLQVNFITGGLLLVIAGQHNCMDMRGQSQLIHLFTKACRSEPFTKEELHTGNLPRENIIPLLAPPPPCKQTTKPPRRPSKSSIDSLPPQKSKWTSLLYTPQTLSALKNNSTTEPPLQPQPSTDDLLTAQTWHLLTTLRLKHHNAHATHPIHPSTPTTLTRQVDIRAHLGLPGTYMGNAVGSTSTTLPIATLLAQPVHQTASLLRTALNAREEITTAAKHTAHRLHAETQKGPYDADVDLPTPRKNALDSFDVKLSSWMKEPSCTEDFSGLLGQPVAVRRPAFEGWEGLVYLLPRGREGEVVVGVCVGEDEAGRLEVGGSGVEGVRWVG